MDTAAVERVAADVAARHADAVDRDARFPAETLAALKALGALGAGIPRALGGGGSDIVALSAMCQALGRHCASSAMVLAMHHIMVAALVRHGLGSEQIRDYLARVAREQRLIASVTSEVGTDGDMRRSIAALEPTESGFSFTKQATTVSYGAYADDLLVTVRRDSAAADNDQVLVLALRGDFDFQVTGVWDTLGMRGTCSPPGVVSARGAAWQVLDAPFSSIAANSMVPVSHILWSALWLGIATDAVDRARRLMQQKARKDPNATRGTAARIALLDARLQSMRAEQESVARDYAALVGSGTLIDSMNVGFGLRQNNLKLNASRLVKEIVMDAMEACGIAAYRQDSAFSLGRHMRDALSACVMISNDRILEYNATMQLIHRGR
ncbi:MAG: acyl-CoA/acyl-ACP dehydrogenase [Pseudomonadales bacterium]|nr:acyl-CoA/acyl-ACP dehydrogenase [Pseudomonadales bacterium]